MIAEVTHPLQGEWMTPRRRFLSAVYRGHVDKIPACTLSSVVTVELMDLVNAPFPEAHLDAESIFAGIKRFAEERAQRLERQRSMLTALG